MFTAILVMIFASQEAGNATGWTPDLAKASAAAKRVFDFVDTPSEINAPKMTEQNEGLDCDKVVGKIEFRDVWFRYPMRKEDFVLKGLNLTINPKDSVALVGESGCGKSTFINLLMRFYDPEYGQVLLDDVDIRQYNLHSLRKAISLVMQEPIVFNYTLVENILYGKLDASNTEVEEAAEIANCTEFIQKGELVKMDDSAAALVDEMKANRDAIVRVIGEEKYNEEMEVLAKCLKQE